MDSYSVGIAYRFYSNAKAVLGEVVAQSDLATESIDRLTAAYRENSAASRIMNAAQQRIQRALGMTVTAARDAAAQVGGSYKTMADAAVTSSDEMATATRAAATSINASTRVITRRFGAVTAAAKRAQLAVGGMAGALNAVPSGLPGSGGGSARHGGAGGKWGLAGQLTAAGVMALGIAGGAKFQDASAQTGVAMGMSTAATERMFAPYALQMSGQTAQSMATSMGLLSTLAMSGFNSQNDLKQLSGPISKFADVMYLQKGKKHMDFENSTGMAATLAHQLGTRDPASLEKMLNTIAKINMDMPDSIRQAANQIKYYGPQFAATGMDPSEILQLQATADRLGLGGGRSGTGFRQIYQSLLHPTAPQWRAQKNLGLIDGKGYSKYIKRDGSIDIESFFKDLDNQYQYLAKTHGDIRAFQTQVAGITTATGQSDLALFTSKSGQEQREKVRQTLMRVPDLDAMQAQLMMTLSNETKKLITNFENLAQIITGPIIEPLTHFIDMLGNAIGTLNTFLAGHGTIAGVLTAAVGAAGTVGAYKAIRMGIGIGHTAASIGKHGLSVHGWGSDHIRVGGGAVDEASTLGRFDRAGAFAKDQLYNIMGFSKIRGAIGGAIRSGPAMQAGGAFMRQFPGFGEIGPIMARFGEQLVGVSGALGSVSDVLFHMGARALPLVGEILLLIDTLRFLGSHAKSIGQIIGDVAHWIVKSGGPMFVGAVKSVWGYIIDTVKFLFDGIVGTIEGVFNGGQTGIWKWLHDVVDASKAQYAKDDSNDAKAATTQKTRAATRGTTDARPAGRKRNGTAGKVAMLDAGGGGGPIFTGPVTIHATGSSPAEIHQSIVQKALALADRHLVKSTPGNPGLTGAGLTLGDAALA
jgi:TP901 family phage tail tape measure protein